MMLISRWSHEFSFTGDPVKRTFLKNGHFRCGEDPELAKLSMWAATGLKQMRRFILILRKRRLIKLTELIRKIAVLFFLLGTSNFCLATEQEDDVLYFESQQYEIKEVPLHTGLDPEELAGIVGPVKCTGSWRGYKAYWFISDDILWLSRILINPCGDAAEYIKADVLFSNQEYPIKADWFTGDIGLVVGEREYIQGTAPDNSLGYKNRYICFSF